MGLEGYTEYIVTVLRYICGEQEVVLILDGVKKTYTIVKGIGE